MQSWLGLKCKTKARTHGCVHTQTLRQNELLNLDLDYSSDVLALSLKRFEGWISPTYTSAVG